MANSYGSQSPQHLARHSFPRKRLAVPGGTAGEVMDLANSGRDAPSEVAPGIWRTNLPRQPVMVGHVCDSNDQTSPILTTGELTEPAEDAFIDACTGCDPAVYCTPGPLFTRMIVEHQPGCPVWADVQSRRVRR